MPEVSIIVPVYKTEAYLPRCIDSILAQTFTDFELILVNDGSPDKCPAICDDYAIKDSRVKVIHQTNQGQASARNNGVRAATGQWVCFVDSDDMIHPQMLEVLFYAVNDAGAKLSVCGVYESEHIPQKFVEPCDTSFRIMDVSESTMMELLNTGKHRYWIACAKLVERNILIRYPFTPGRIFEDNAVVYKWIHLAGRITNCNADLYFYAVNPSGTTQSTFSIKQLDFLWAMEEQIAFYRSLGYEKMLSRICTGYILTAADFYTKVRKELLDKANARAIRRRINVLRRRFSRYIQLSSEQKKYIHNQLWPRVSAVCRYIRAFSNTMVQNGISGVLQKVSKKLTKR